MHQNDIFEKLKLTIFFVLRLSKIIVSDGPQYCETCHTGYSESWMATPSKPNISFLGADHLIRGGGLWFFLRDQTFFFDSQLKRTIFFRPYQKQTIFFSAVKPKTIFLPYISFYSPHTLLSSQGVTTFIWTFHHVF